MAGKIEKRERAGKVVWTCVVNLPPDPETGKRRQSRISKPTKREVEQELARLLVDMAGGTYAEANAKKMTVEEYLDRWLKSAEAGLRPSSYRRYSEMCATHFKPALGKKLLAKLTPLDVENYFADKLAKGLSPTTLNMQHAVLHRALDRAVRWNLVPRNVTEAVDPPREARIEYVTWDEKQVRAFLTVADNDPLAAFWRLALLTGMRRGEMLGLQWSAVDLVRGTLQVTHTLSRGNGGTYEMGEPKTNSGRRQIALPPSVVASLKKHRLTQVEERLHLDKDYNDQDFVFADKTGEPLHPNTLRLRFLRLVKLAGVPAMRLHDLRHTSATLMLANGEHAKIVSERLGHSSISITLDRYSHVTPQMQRDAANRLDSLIEGSA
jgi:integrase